MALAYDQAVVRARVGGADSSAMTSAQAVDAGDLLVVCLSTFFSAGTPEVWTVSGSLNGTYSQPSPGSETPSTAAQAAIAIFYKENSAAGSETVTVNPNGSSADIDFTFSEVSGAATSTALDNAVVNAPTQSSTPNIASGVLDQANEIIFAVATYDGSTVSFSGDGTYTLVGSNADNSTGQAYYAQYKIVSSTASDTADWTLGSGLFWGCVLATFKEASAAATIDQEGFRFRNDDGSESGATWKAAQDTNAAVTSDTNIRLRMLVNATGDPAATQYQLEYRRVGTSTWRKVE